MVQSDKIAHFQGTSRATSTWLSFFLCKMVPSALLFICFVVLVGWMLGDITTLFQWLSWVPVSVVLLVLLVSLMLSMTASGRGGHLLRRVSCISFFFALVWVSVVDFGFLRASKADGEDLVLINWNAAIPPGDDSFGEALDHSDEALHLLASLDAEVLIIFNGSYLRLSSKWKTFQETYAHVTQSAGAMVLSTHEILQVRPILAAEGSLIVKIRLRYGGEEMVLWGFDLPSSPSLSRSELFTSLREKLDQMNEADPDLLVGDFNVPRSSRALHRAFPGFQNAFSEAGSGWSGTWPAFLPLWDLDQVLVGPDLSTVRYEVVTPPFGMHRIQRAVLRW